VNRRRRERIREARRQRRHWRIITTLILLAVAAWFLWLIAGEYGGRF
jgi:hypothetical protein